MDKAALEGYLGRLDVWLLIFGVLAAIAAAGLAVAGYMRWRAGNRLNTIQSAENLSQQHAIEAARLEAAKAAERAAQATERAAEANRLAESERLERVKIEKRLADRTLSAEQISTMSEKLRVFGGQRVLVIAVPGPEPQAFAKKLEFLMRQSNWEMPISASGGFTLGSESRGVDIHLQPSLSDEQTMPAAVMLAELLRSEGFETSEPASGNLGMIFGGVSIIVNVWKK